VLVGRLVGVTEKIISANQSPFIKERHLVYGVIALNEVIYLAIGGGQRHKPGVRRPRAHT